MSVPVPVPVSVSVSVAVDSAPDPGDRLLPHLAASPAPPTVLVDDTAEIQAALSEGDRGDGPRRLPRSPPGDR
ncbi:hypothetical protein [Streptomyces humi]